MLEPALPKPVLALGGDLKSVICIGTNSHAVLSEHLGDLENPAAFRNFVGAIDRFKNILKVEPELCVCDLHPGYHSVRHAKTLGLPLLQVQHHHAHLESCKLEHNLTGPVVGLSADGTGYGTDGAIWGCELMLAKGAEFERLGHLRYFPLPGGDQAARETWRPGISLLHCSLGESWRDKVPFFQDTIPEPAVTMTEARLVSPATPQCSSLGRLFDGVAFITGICEVNRFEAQAAMALEAAATEFGPAKPLTFDVETDDLFIFDWRPMIRELVDLRNNGVAGSELAARFHATLVAMFSDALDYLCAEYETDDVVLSGGCFLNRILARDLTTTLRNDGITPYLQQTVPTGDGGLSLGQLAIAKHTLN